MPMSTCGSCKKIFSSTSLFDAHRIGSFGEPVYDQKDVERDAKKKRVLSYTKSSRRCMTTEELLQAGYQFEHKPITVTRDGQARREEHDVWYDPVAREKMRAAFGRSEEEDEG